MARPFIYRCPTTGLNVQALLMADEVPASAPYQYEAVTCLACRAMHIVDPRTGKLVVDREKK